MGRNGNVCDWCGVEFMSDGVWEDTNWREEGY